MKVAIFDFDGTLLRGNSWHLFYWWMVRRHAGRAPWLLLLLLFRRLGLISARNLKEQTLAIWRGRSRAEVAEMGREVYTRCLGPRMRPAALREIAERRGEGCEIALVSGAFEFLIAPFAEAQAIRRWQATRLAFAADGRCAGRIDGSEVVGDEKLMAARALFSGVTVDWAESVAYGDEWTDLPLLSIVGRPVWVRNRRRPPAGLPPGCSQAEWGD